MFVAEECLRCHMGAEDALLEELRCTAADQLTLHIEHMDIRAIDMCQVTQVDIHGAGVHIAEREIPEVQVTQRSLDIGSLLLQAYLLTILVVLAHIPHRTDEHKGKCCHGCCYQHHAELTAQAQVHESAPADEEHNAPKDKSRHQQQRQYIKDTHACARALPPGLVTIQ